LGAAVAAGRPTVLLTGDLGLLHDLGGLVSARRCGASLCVVVVNNDGGGIFSFLPLVEATPHFEPLFSTPHGMDFAAAAALAGGQHRAPASATALRRDLEEALEGGRWIIEVKTNRRENVAEHEALWARLVRAVEQEGTP
jgi:2-succinyl-5-enolpyruvyl-6-hydroxy-3-cyclohexene-1-carboxylate synthase